MTYQLALLFGAVQGLTEFLPVSSSGHIAILSMLALEEADLVFTLFLHLATFAAVCVAYRKEILALIKEFFSYIPNRMRKRPSKDPETLRFLGLMIVSLLPLFAVVPVKDKVEAAFESPLAIGVMLMLTALLLFLGNRYGRGNKTVSEMTVRDALIIGLFQMCAVLPGLSRSGATIAAGLLCGLDRETAVKFSFIMSLPTILAAAFLEALDLTSESLAAIFSGPYLAGFAAAAICGYLAIGLVRMISKDHKLWIFSIYCAALSAGLLSAYFSNLI